jgi:hypothetical protein
MSWDGVGLGIEVGVQFMELYPSTILQVAASQHIS